MEEMCPSHTWPKPLASLSAGAISSWALRLPRLSLAAQAFSLVAVLRAAWEAWPHRPKSPEEQESLARAEVGIPISSLLVGVHDSYMTSSKQSKVPLQV